MLYEVITLSLACTDEGLKVAEDILHAAGFQRVLQWVPDTNDLPGLDINAMPNYVFQTFDYPKHYKKAEQREKEELLLDMRLKIRRALEKDEMGFAYSFWPDVVTLKEIGDPRDIGTYFNLRITSYNVCYTKLLRPLSIPSPMT